MQRGRMRIAAMLAGVMLLGGTAALALAATPEQIIKERRDGFKEQGKDFKAMYGAVKSGAEVKPLATKAGYIVEWSAKFPGMFPPDTKSGGGTHAKPDIWTNRAEFDKLAKDLHAQAEKLQSAAESGDKAAFAVQFKATAKVCGECHHTFRYKIS